MNGVVDVSDLLALLAAWGPQDACHPANCNGDTVVDVSYLLALLAAWGTCPGGNSCYPLDCPADLNRDGVVDASDLLILLANWGQCPEFPDPDSPPLSHEQVVLASGLTMNDWNDFVDVMSGTDERRKANWNCWMKTHISQCVVCTTCPGPDPFN